eukprot:767352-Hanusia_phi.AAC.6
MDLKQVGYRTYLPRKFKVAVTVPGDNSIDAYTHDVCLIVIMDESGKNLKGYNIMVGGGMGRTHNKETTFARTADHLGYVAKEDLTEVMKSILAAQRDHGNREIRANARLKYLVHTLGVDNFRKLVESYFGKKIQPWVPLPEWQMVDWLGWHPQGDGKWFLGVNVEQGRIKNEGSFKLKTALRKIVDTYGCDIRLTPHQNIELCGIEEKDKASIDAILKEHGIKSLQEIDDMTRKGIACPAFPLCGLAQSEAERVMPQYIKRISTLMEKMGLPGESFVMRMTGCPNGCARPYMAEMAFVGMGGDSYQIWLGGSPNQDGRTAWRWKDRVKNEDVEGTIEPLLYMWKSQRNGQAERFGDFIHRLGQEAVDKYVESYELGTAFKNVVVEKLPSKKVAISLIDRPLRFLMIPTRQQNKSPSWELPCCTLLPGIPASDHGAAAVRSLPRPPGGPQPEKISQPVRLIGPGRTFRPRTAVPAGLGNVTDGESDCAGVVRYRGGVRPPGERPRWRGRAPAK